MRRALLVSAWILGGMLPASCTLRQLDKYGTCDPDTAVKGSSPPCGGPTGCPRCRYYHECDRPSDCSTAACDLEPDGFLCVCPSTMTDRGKGALVYCIDNTEVTNAEFEAFLSLPPRRELLPERCNSRAIGVHFKSPVVAANHNKPAVDVEYCYAYLYCRSKGKRLCGRVGGGPLPVLADNAPPREALIEEWLDACRGTNETRYAYGDAFVAGACVGHQSGNLDQMCKTQRTVNVDATTKCGSRDAPALKHMNGNVWEWIDACEPYRGSFQCMARGGGITSAGDFEDDEQNLACSSFLKFQRGGCDVGFRCCSGD